MQSEGRLAVQAMIGVVGARTSSLRRSTRTYGDARPSGWLPDLPQIERYGMLRSLAAGWHPIMPMSERLILREAREAPSARPCGPKGALAPGGRLVSLPAVGRFDPANQLLQSGDLLGERGVSGLGEGDPGPRPPAGVALFDLDQAGGLQHVQVLGQVAAG